MGLSHIMIYWPILAANHSITISIFHWQFLTQTANNSANLQSLYTDWKDISNYWEDNLRYSWHKGRPLLHQLSINYKYHLPPSYVSLCVLLWYRMQKNMLLANGTYPTFYCAFQEKNTKVLKTQECDNWNPLIAIPTFRNGISMSILMRLISSCVLPCKTVQIYIFQIIHNGMPR